MSTKRINIIRHNWPIWLNGLVFIYELSGCVFESSCRHLNFRFRACFEQGVPWDSGNYGVWIHSKMRMRHDKNIQLNFKYFNNRCLFSSKSIYILNQFLIYFSVSIVSILNQILFMITIKLNEQTKLWQFRKIILVVFVFISRVIPSHSFNHFG